MSDLPSLYQVMRETRAIRNFRPEPVPLPLIENILEHAVGAPSVRNHQPWRFLLLVEPSSKRFFGDRYLIAMRRRFARSRAAHRATKPGIAEAMLQLAECMHQVPLILLVCGRREWPFGLATAQRIGKQPVSPSSVFPCIQNILLACRAEGLGACLTTMHEAFEEELCHYFDIPDEFGVAAALPIGYPDEPFGKVKRTPARRLTFVERWGRAT